MRWSGLALLVCLLLVPTSALAEGERIVEIEVAENTKTTDATVILIADVEVGDTFTYALIEKIRANLIGSGLFSDVNVFTSPAQGGVKLTIVADEKHSWVVGPTFYNEPGNVGGGLGFGEANLFGENKKLLLYGQIATADSLFVAGYLDPNIGGSPFYYRLYLFGRREKVTEYTYPDIDTFLGEPQPDRRSIYHEASAGVQLGVEIWKGLKIDVELVPSYVWFGEDVERVDPMDPQTPPGDDGWDVSMEARLIRDKRAKWHGVIDGSLFEISYLRGLPELGSEMEYWAVKSKLQLAWKIGSEQNFVMKLGGAIGDQLPFQREFTSGGTGLRGYRNRQFRGDTKVAGNLEYSIPLFKIQPFSFRGMAFWDSAWTAFTREEGNPVRDYLPGQTGLRFNQWRNGVGAGFRVYIRSVVLPLLGVDVGYGLENNEVRIYFALGLVEM